MVELDAAHLVVYEVAGDLIDLLEVFQLFLLFLLALLVFVIVVSQLLLIAEYFLGGRRLVAMFVMAVAVVNKDLMVVHV